MRPMMTLMGSLLLAGNLILGMPLRANVTIVRSGEQAEREIRREMAEILVDRGLEPAAAREAVMKHYGAAASNLALQIHHAAALFPEIGRQAIVRYTAEQALRSQAFDLRSYDHIIAMLQKLHAPVLNGSQHSRAMHCALLNRSVP